MGESLPLRWGQPGKFSKAFSSRRPASPSAPSLCTSRLAEPGGGAVLGERVAAARFGKAPFELGARAVEEQRLDVAPARGAQVLDMTDEQRGAEAAAAAVDADREIGRAAAPLSGRPYRGR